MPGEREIAQALLTNYEPSLRDRAGNAIYDIAQALGMGSTANRMRNEGTAVMDFIPGVGEVLGVNDAMNDFNAGNYGMAAAGLGLTAAGAVPGVGDAAAYAARNLMERAAQRGVDLHISTPRGRMVIDKIVIPPSGRGQGVGTEVMNEVIGFADANKIPLSLTPSSDFGGNKSRLEGFYKRLGFEKNSGRNRDFEISESMRRYPR